MKQHEQAPGVDILAGFTAAPIDGPGVFARLLISR